MKFSTEKGTEIEADMVFFCQGSHINCGAYEKNFKDCMSDRVFRFLFFVFCFLFFLFLLLFWSVIHAH